MIPPFRHETALMLLTLFTLAGGRALLAAPPPIVSPTAETTAVNIRDIKALNLDGSAFEGTELAGKIVLLDFWAVWCTPCIVAVPTLESLADELRDNNFEVLGIAVYSGTVEDVRESVTRHNIDYQVVLGDPALVMHFGVIGFPTYLLMAPDGNIYKKYVGAAANLRSKFKADILALGSGLSTKMQPGGVP